MIRGQNLYSCITSERKHLLHFGMKKISIILIISALCVLSACTIDSFENTTEPVTEQETQLTGQIIGESISENQRGILSTFSEAFAVPTSSGLMTGPSLLSSGSFRNLDNYSHSYDDISGEHKVTYTVQRDTPLLSSSADVELTYIFYDTDGSAIRFPDQDMSRIESVDFSSQQSGTITTGTKNSVFTRTDSILMNGVNDQSDILTLDGFHTGEGVFSSTTDTTGTQIQREYLLDMNYLDIRINKEVVLSNRNFRDGVNGALSYESTVRETSGASGNTKIVNGTIELNGDGTALLNFRDQIDPLRLRLDDGDVFDEDEFEGRITNVDLENNIITIANGQRIRVDDQTEIDDGDYRSLEEVASALTDNRRVVAEGEYFHPDENVNLWVATEVEFERESNEFDDLVVAVNVVENQFTLLNGDEYVITGSSDIDFDDELTSLQDVADAVDSGLPVIADGEFTIDPENGNRMVEEADFELEFDDFEDIVTSVDLETQTFTLENGREILVNNQTEIDDDSDYNSLEEVSDALMQQLIVEADGSYYPTTNGTSWIAVEVEFKREEDDGDDDDDDEEE